MLAPLADRDRPDQLRAGADAHVAADRRAGDVARAQPDRHERRDHDARLDLDEPVERPPGRGPRRHPGPTTTGSPIESCAVTIASRCSTRGSTGTPTSLESRLGAVQRLREERVADPREPQDLERRVSSPERNSWRSPRCSAVTRASSRERQSRRAGGGRAAPPRTPPGPRSRRLCSSTVVPTARYGSRVDADAMTDASLHVQLDARAPATRSRSGAARRSSSAAGASARRPRSPRSSSCSTGTPQPVDSHGDAAARSVPRAAPRA